MTSRHRTQEPTRVVFVCTGNICRSVMAEKMLDEAVYQAGLERRIQVSSAGISDEEAGNSMDPRAAMVLEEIGIDPGAHTARQLDVDRLSRAEVVVAMTAGHLRALRRLSSSLPEADRPQSFMLRAFDPRFAAGASAAEVSAGGPEADVGLVDGISQAADPALDVEDPWYGTLDDFHTVREQITAALPRLLVHLRNLAR